MPPIKPIIHHSASDLAQAIRDRQLSSESIIEAYLEQSKLINPPDLWLESSVGMKLGLG